jgi:hypothetical protein
VPQIGPNALTWDDAVGVGDGTGGKCPEVRVLAENRQYARLGTPQPGAQSDEWGGWLGQRGKLEPSWARGSNGLSTGQRRVEG